MVLVKKISKIGNSWGVILPSEVLKVAGMEPDSECEIKVDSKGIFLKPRSAKGKKNKLDQQVIEAMTRFIKKYREDLKKLA